MERNVKTYCIEEIDNECIKRINTISKYAFYHDDDEFLQNVEELIFYYEKYPGTLFIIMGEDWYIIYNKYGDYIEIDEWTAILETKDKLIQSLEMYNAFVELFINNCDMKFKVSLLENTSYPFYLKMKERGYVEELSIGYSIYGDKTYHDITFKVTDKFIKRYGESRKLKRSIIL